MHLEGIEGGVHMVKIYCIHRMKFSMKKKRKEKSCFLSPSIVREVDSWDFSWLCYHSWEMTLSRALFLLY